MLHDKEESALQKVNMLIDYYIDKIQSQTMFSSDNDAGTDNQF